jgi:hypothetical protein
VSECRFYDDSNDGADASAKTGPRIAQAISPTMHVKNEDYRRETGLLGAGRRRAAVVEWIAVPRSVNGVNPPLRLIDSRKAIAITHCGLVVSPNPIRAGEGRAVGRCPPPRGLLVFEPRGSMRERARALAPCLADTPISISSSGLGTQRANGGLRSTQRALASSRC